MAGDLEPFLIIPLGNTAHSVIHLLQRAHQPPDHHQQQAGHHQRQHQTQRAHIPQLFAAENRQIRCVRHGDQDIVHLFHGDLRADQQTAPGILGNKFQLRSFRCHSFYHVQLLGFFHHAGGGYAFAGPVEGHAGASLFLGVQHFFHDGIGILLAQQGFILLQAGHCHGVLHGGGHQAVFGRRPLLFLLKQHVLALRQQQKRRAVHRQHNQQQRADKYFMPELHRPTTLFRLATFQAIAQFGNRDQLPLQPHLPAHLLDMDIHRPGLARKFIPPNS